MLVINSPQNPTGSVLEKDDLEKIADFAKEHDLFVVSDECYERIIYDAEHISIASLPGMQERTIIVNACSKTYSMTGWRIGFVASTPEIIDSMVRVHQDVTTCACSFAQAGAVEALRHGRSAVEAMVKEFRRRRDLVVKYLDQIEGLEYVKPQGAFYVFPSIKNFNMGAEEFCDYILKEAGVALVPGNAFGDYGEDFVRIAYSSSYEKIEEGMQRIKEAIAKI
jgi:aspartate aminotransferase/aminotransferase